MLQGKLENHIARKKRSQFFCCMENSDRDFNLHGNLTCRFYLARKALSMQHYPLITYQVRVFDVLYMQFEFVSIQMGLVE